MSCGAAAGLSLRELFSFSQDAVHAFTDALMAEPTPTSVVIRTQTGVAEIELVPVFGG